MNSIQSGLICHNIPSDFRKYIQAQMKYFTFRWNSRYRPSLKSIMARESQTAAAAAGAGAAVAADGKPTVEGQPTTGKPVDAEAESLSVSDLSRLEASMLENERLMKYINLNVYEAGNTVQQISDLTDKSLTALTTGRARLRRVAKITKMTRALKTLACSAVCIGLALAILIIWSMVYMVASPFAAAVQAIT